MTIQPKIPRDVIEASIKLDLLIEDYNFHIASFEKRLPPVPEIVLETIPETKIMETPDEN